MTIGEKIKSLREEKELTQKELSDRAGCAITTLSRLEHGSRNPKLQTVIKIATALQVDYYYFYEMPTVEG